MEGNFGKKKKSCVCVCVRTAAELKRMERRSSPLGVSRSSPNNRLLFLQLLLSHRGAFSSVLRPQLGETSREGYNKKRNVESEIGGVLYTHFLHTGPCPPTQSWRSVTPKNIPLERAFYQRWNKTERKDLTGCEFVRRKL